MEFNMPLYEVGELPSTTRGTGRKRGVWRGHEEEAEQLRKIAERHPEQWGKVEQQVTASKAQQIASAIKNNTTADFRSDSDGAFIAHARKSKDQSGAPLDKKSGKPVVLYDVWARYVLKKKRAKGAKKTAEDEAPIAATA